MAPYETLYVASTARRALLAAAQGCTHRVYVDNGRLQGTYRQCVAGLALVRDRCRRIGFTLNQPEDVEPTQREDFLGLDCDFARKLVCASSRMVAKLAVSWSNRDDWSTRGSGRHIGLLNAISDRLALPRCEMFVVMQFCALAFTLDRRDKRWDTTIVIPPHVRDALATWTAVCLENRPMRPLRHAQPFTWCVVVDSSSHGIGYAGICLTTGVTRLGRSRWCADEPHVRAGEEFVNSTHGETLGALVATRALFPNGTHDHVHYATDSTACRKAYDCGYSRRAALNDTMLKVKSEFPYMRTTASHWPGARMPVDAMSRMIRTPAEEKKRPEFWKQLREVLVAVGCDEVVATSGSEGLAEAMTKKRSIVPRATQLSTTAEEMAEACE